MSTTTEADEAEREHDVVVLGSGAAGLVAAIAAADEGAKVGLYEKRELIGGTSAMSGGIIWMPNNHLQADAGPAMTFGFIAGRTAGADRRRTENRADG